MRNLRSILVQHFSMLKEQNFGKQLVKLG